MVGEGEEDPGRREGDDVSVIYCRRKGQRWFTREEPVNTEVVIQDH